jgi:hypothetical protein
MHPNRQSGVQIMMVMKQPVERKNARLSEGASTQMLAGKSLRERSDRYVDLASKARAHAERALSEEARQSWISLARSWESLAQATEKTTPR